MSISDLFKQLKIIEDEMALPIIPSDVDALNELDERHEQAWEAILDFTPENPEVAELMLLLLLNKMIDRAKDGANVAQIREKVLELFQMSQTNLASDDMLYSVFQTRENIA